MVPNVAKLIFKLEISRHAPASEDQIDEFQKGLEAQCIDACDTAMGELKSMENGYVSAGLGNEWTKFVAAARKVGTLSANNTRKAEY